MYGLEASEPHPLPRPGPGTDTKAERLSDGPARVAAASRLMAVGGPWIIPRLEGIPREYRLFEGIDVAARLAKTVVSTGLAEPALWVQAGRDPFRFVEQALKDHVRAHGGPEIEKEFFLRLGLVSDLDPYGHDVDERPPRARCTWFWSLRALGTS
jgi:hypothetical protein